MGTEKKERFKLFKDILTEGSKYSQGRVYLLWSVVAYYITLGTLTVAAMNPKMQIELEKFKIILDALEYAMTLFGGYVFGGKFITAYTAIKGANSSESKTTESEEGMM